MPAMELNSLGHVTGSWEKCQLFQNETKKKKEWWLHSFYNVSKLEYIVVVKQARVSHETKQSWEWGSVNFNLFRIVLFLKENKILIYHFYSWIILWGKLAIFPLFCIYNICLFNQKRGKCWKLAQLSLLWCALCGQQEICLRKCTEHNELGKWASLF